MWLINRYFIYENTGTLVKGIVDLSEDEEQGITSMRYNTYTNEVSITPLRDVQLEEAIVRLEGILTQLKWIESTIEKTIH